MLSVCGQVFINTEYMWTSLLINTLGVFRQVYLYSEYIWTIPHVHFVYVDTDSVLVPY